MSVAHSRKRITSITVGFDEALKAVSAENSGFYGVFRGVKKRRKMVFTKRLAIRGVSYDASAHRVTISLAKSFKGKVQVIVHGGIAAVDGAASSGDSSWIVK
jgi:hypothetical protein